MIEKMKAVLSIVSEIFIWTLTFAVIGVAFTFMSLFRYYGVFCLIAAIIIVGGDKIIHKFVEKKNNKENEEEE